MKENRVLGIIAEYNPFHNGHMYHLQKAKEQSGAEYCIGVISGNFVQRGNTSILNKWKKAEMAILNGVDLVIELPTIYSVASAEGFSLGAIKLLNTLKIVDAISFGTETDDFAALNNISSIIYDEPKKYKDLLSKELKKGLSFPKARENALMLYLDDNKRYANILNMQNNILAIEYLKALKKTRSTIQPIPVKREKVYYNDNVIVDEFASATAIRKMLKNREFNEIRKVVPKSTYEILKKEDELGNIVLDLSEYEKEIIYNLRKMSVDEIAELPDVNEGLEHSIKNAANFSNDITNLINIIKTKRYTVTRIQRILICSLLGITKKDFYEAKKIEPYIRVLGFNEKGKSLLSRINKENPRAQVITSVKKFEGINNNSKSSKIYRRLLNIDIFSTNVYTMACKNDLLANLDYTKNMVIM